MRFGKRLAELIQRDSSNLPYVKYKDLKHTVGELTKIIQDGGLRSEEDDGASSGEEGPREPAMSSAPAACAPSTEVEVACTDVESTVSRLKQHEQEFFNQIDRDLQEVVVHVQSAVVSLEAALGELQCAAIRAGLLFTPKQMEEVTAQLPFEVQDQEMVAKWVHSLHPTDSSKVESYGLIEKYGNISLALNQLMQYIEVNLTAVRKILKKFEKKVPAAVRGRHARSYKAHHELLMPALRHILITSQHMQHVIIAACPQVDATLQAIIRQGAHVGPESHAVLSKLHGPGHLDNVLSPPLIDVYAKPNADASTAQGKGGAAGSEAAAASSRQTTTGRNVSKSGSTPSASQPQSSMQLQQQRPPPQQQQQQPPQQQQQQQQRQQQKQKGAGQPPYFLAQVPVFVGGVGLAAGHGKGWQQPRASNKGSPPEEERQEPGGQRAQAKGGGRGTAKGGGRGKDKRGGGQKGGGGKGASGTQDRGTTQTAGCAQVPVFVYPAGASHGWQKQNCGNKGCYTGGKGFGADGTSGDSQDQGGVQIGGYPQAMTPAVNVQWYGRQGALRTWS